MALRCSVAVVLVMLSSAPALSQTQGAGRIKAVTGVAAIVRGGQTSTAMVGAVVYEQDRIATGADGHVGLTLRDDTRLSIGPNSTVDLNRFLYEPATSQFGFVLKVVQGVVAYVSGRIAKLRPDAVRLETPSAIVGVRGTRLVIRVGR